MLWENTVSCKLLDLLKNLQREEIFKDYILAGGTALALQAGHRESEDIDLFTVAKQDNETLRDYFRDKYNVVETPLTDRDNILQLMVNDIKVDLISVKGKMFETPIIENGIKMFSVHDIIGMKLLAIGDRKKAKDYIDIACMLRQIPLEKMFAIYKYKYDTDNISSVKCNLLDVDKINPYTWQNVKILWKDFFVSDVSQILKDEVRKYNEKYDIGKKTILSIGKSFINRVMKKNR